MAICIDFAGITVYVEDAGLFCVRKAGSLFKYSRQNFLYVRKRKTGRREFLWHRSMSVI